MRLQIKKRTSREITVGNLKIGGENRVAIQTMLTESLSQVSECIRKINHLEKFGCDLVRIAVRSKEEISNIKEIKKEVSLPIVADIQFNYEHALLAIDSGFDGVRINPGYISDKEKAALIIDKAGEKNCAVRIGFNSGSLSKKILEGKRKNISREDLIIEEAISLIENFEKRGFYNFKLSLKSSSVLETISLNRKISKLTLAPLHLGVTEAGPLLTSCVRSSIAFGSLLLSGIGDTIRVSITGDPDKEVEAAKEILRSLEMYDFGVTIVSCPTCARAIKDLAGIVDLVTEKTGKIRKKMKIAVMGCAVNGPGEAKEADLGIAGAGSDTFSFFKNGEIIASFKSEDAIKKLLYEIEKCEGLNV